jgi:hypothetical protein
MGEPNVTLDSIHSASPSHGPNAIHVRRAGRSAGALLPGRNAAMQFGAFCVTVRRQEAWPKSTRVLRSA